MSLPPNGSTQIPVETEQVARAAFPKGSLGIRVRDELGALFADEQFEELHATRGRPGWSPARLALVMVLQFVEGLTDRQAADAVRGRLDWKYCLGLELRDPGFDASVLTEFRARLATDGQTERLLTLMLDRLREHGLLGKGGRHRTDATHVHMAVRDLHRLEQVIATVRAALEVLSVAAPSWLLAVIPREWGERYGQRGDDWRLPKSEDARVERAIAIGEDGYWLLEALVAPVSPAGLAELEAVQVLRQTWIQQFHRDSAGGTRWRGKETGLPPGKIVILSPYDLDARPGIKRSRNWRGYKAHFTEVCDPDRPHLITHVATTDASTSDLDTVRDRHRDLAAVDLLPDVHLVDGGYVSVGQILTAADEHAVDLVGPLRSDTSWQAGEDTAFDLTRFTIDWDAQRVVCPRGKISRNWRPDRSRDGLPVLKATFRLPDCRPCPDRGRCTRSETNARHITFRPRREHEAQQRIRAEQSTADWRERYSLRLRRREPDPPSVSDG